MLVFGDISLMWLITYLLSIYFYYVLIFIHFTIKQMPLRIPKFIKRVVSFIFSQSHLTFYKHILKQQRTQKIVRLYQDKSFIHQDQVQRQREESESTLSKRKILSALYSFIYRENKCINPCIKKLLIWYFLVFLSFLYFLIEVGILVAFGQPSFIFLKNSQGYIVASIIFLLILYIDVVVQFVTGYIYQGILVLQPQKVVAHYLRYQFIFDLAIVIIQSIALNIQSFTINYFKLVIFLKFIRIYQIDKFYLRRLSLNKILKVMYVIFKQMVIIFIASHIIGVVFYIIDFYFVNTPLCEGDNQQYCWLYDATAYSPIIELSYPLQYFYIIYYGINTVTTISYGDIQAKNPWEQIYQIPIFLFSFIIYAYIVNNIINIILWVRKQSDQYKSQLLLIDLYMKDLKIKHKLKTQIHSYLQFLYIEQLNRDKESEQQLIAKLPQDLQSELFQGLYSQIYSQLVYMFKLNQEVKGLLSHIQESIYTRNQEIIPQNQFLQKLLYLQRGQVKLECLVHSNTYQITKIDFGNFVGTSSFIRQDKLSFSIIAQKSVHMYSLDRKFFQQNCSNGSFKESMRRLQYFVKVCHNYAKISQRCYYCEQNHLWNECPKKFPQFKNIQLSSNLQAKSKREKAKQRGLRHNVLVCKKDLKVLEVFAKISEDEFYNKIQKRLKTIRQRIEISRQLFEVDAAYDWQIYLPEQNLSKLRFVWQQKKLQNNLARKTVFRFSRQISY